MKSLMIATLTLLSLSACGVTKSGHYVELKDGSFFRGHTITSADATAPTITTVLLETCEQSIAVQSKEHVSQTEHLPNDKNSGYVRRDRVETVEPVNRLECDLIVAGQHSGPSRMRVITSPIETTIGAAGFVAGMHMLEPNKYNSSTSLNSTGGGANATGTGGSSTSNTGATTQTTTASSDAATGAVTASGGSATSSSQSDSTSNNDGIINNDINNPAPR